MARTIAIVQARMTSTRLPGKVLLPLAGTPLIDRVLERLSSCESLDGLCIAIPNGEAQIPLMKHLEAWKEVGVVRGSEDDVLERTFKAAESENASVVVRVTSDCPFIDPKVVDALAKARQAGNFDYARTSMDSGFPLGFDCEVLTMESLRIAHVEAKDPYEREHVTPFIWRRPERFTTLIFDHKPDRRHWRLVVDTPEDYELAQRVYERLFPEGLNFSYADLIKLFESEPALLTINQSVQQIPYSFGSSS